MADGQTPQERLMAFAQKIMARPIVPADGALPTLHVGDNELPWAEAGDGSATMQVLAAEIGRQLPQDWGLDIAGLSFMARTSRERAPRRRLRIAAAGGHSQSDAGYLVGHLEAVCECRALIRKAVARLQGRATDAGLAYLTDCDVAADPMQTHAPTMSLRFTAEERDAVRTAFESFAAS